MDAVLIVQNETSLKFKTKQTSNAFIYSKNTGELLLFFRRQFPENHDHCLYEKLKIERPQGLTLSNTQLLAFLTKTAEYKHFTFLLLSDA